MSSDVQISLLEAPVETTKTSRRPTHGLGLLLLAIALFALASPLVKWLSIRGGEFGLVKANAISFCNVLFLANLCAGLLTFIWSRREISPAFGGLDRRGVAMLAISVVLAAVIPALLFTAIANTGGYECDPAWPTRVGVLRDLCCVVFGFNAGQKSKVGLLHYRFRSADVGLGPGYGIPHEG